MANGYTFERDGDGYRFTPDEVDPIEQGNRPFWTGNGPFLLGALAGFIGFATQTVIGMLVGFGLGGWLIFRRLRAPDPGTPVARGPSFLVATTGIVTAADVTIPVGRINSIDIANEFDDYIAGMAGSQTRYAAGSGLAVAADIGHGRRMNTAKTRFIVSVQHGPSATPLAKRLSENGANGLRADIQRVMQGRSLD